MLWAAGREQHAHLHEFGLERVHEDSDVGDLDIDNPAEDAIMASHQVPGALELADSLALPFLCPAEKMGCRLEAARQQVRP